MGTSLHALCLGRERIRFDTLLAATVSLGCNGVAKDLAYYNQLQRLANQLAEGGKGLANWYGGSIAASLANHNLIACALCTQRTIQPPPPPPPIDTPPAIEHAMRGTRHT